MEMKNRHHDKKFIFAAFFITFFLIGLAILFDQKNGEYDNLVELKDMEVQQFQDGSVTQTINTDSLEASDDTIAFLTSHQITYVYADDEEIYRLDSTGGVWGHTTGNVWNFIHVPDGAEQITIQILPCYPEVAGNAVSCYTGNGIKIYNCLVVQSLGAFLISMIIIVIGIYMLVYWIIIHKTTEINAALFNLGLFSVVLGLWAANETDVMTLIFKGRIASAFAAFAYLMLMGIPFALFAREFLEIGDKKIWKGFCFVSLTEMVICYILHFTGIMELRQTLIFTHAILILALIYLLGCMLYKIVKKQVNHRLKICMVGLVFVIFATLRDISGYHMEARDSDLVALLAFLVFILILGIESARQTFAIINKGRRAEELEQFALSDEMTGLYNRNAYDHYVKKKGQKTGHMIVTFDLNNLKECNDRYGHGVGDKYIKDTARIIEEIFGKYGRCYRIGGDEFCTVVKKSENCPMERLIQRMRQEISMLNNSHALPVAADIACGYAVCTEDDTDIEEVRSRADQMMYQNKKQLKKSSS